MDTAVKTDFDHVAERAEALAHARGQLAELVQALEEGLNHLKADAMPMIREAIDRASTAWSGLEAEIVAHPELFVKPRTVSMHGIKFGYGKGKGGLEIDDADRTCALIRKHLPDQAEVLIAAKYSPVKDAIAQLLPADLKRIGVNIKGTGDQVVIRPADGEIDKIVKALIKAAVGAAEEGDE